MIVLGAAEVLPLAKLNIGVGLGELEFSVFRCVLYAVALVFVVLPRVLAAQLTKVLAATGPAWRLQAAAIIAMSFRLAPAIYGLVLFLLGGQRLDLYLLRDYQLPLFKKGERVCRLLFNRTPALTTSGLPAMTRGVS